MTPLSECSGMEEEGPVIFCHPDAAEEMQRRLDDLYAPGNYSYRPSEQNFIYRVEDVAAVLTSEKPFFKMLSGGTYAMAIHRNKKGELKPSNFIRMDKDRRPRRERKRMRRMALTLAKAAV